MGSGGFFGGLSDGIETSRKMALERERFDAEKKTRGLQDEALGLQVTKAKEDKAADDEIKRAGRDAYQSALGQTGPANDDEGNPMPQSQADPTTQKFATIKAMDASMQTALKLGKRDVYKQFLDDSSSMRAQLTAEALAKYQSTNDPAALFDIYDNTYPDGGKIDRASVTVQGTEPGKRTISGKVIHGDKETPLTLSDSDLVKKFSMLSDPKVWMQQTNALNIAQAQKQWDWQNNPKFKIEERKVAVDERKAKVLEDTKPAEEDLKRAQAEYYRGAKTSLTNAQAVRAGGAGGQVDEKARRKLEFDVDATIGKMLAPERKDDGAGKSISVDHPLKDYRAQISSEAMKLIRDNNYDVSPMAAIEKATEGVRTHYETLHQSVGVAFDDALKKKSFFGGMDSVLPALRSDIDAMLANGYTIQEIKKSAKAAGRDPLLVDKALATQPAKNTASGKVSPAGKSFKNLWD